MIREAKGVLGVCPLLESFPTVALTYQVAAKLWKPRRNQRTSARKRFILIIGPV